MKYLLDTNTFSDLVKDDPIVKWRFGQVPLTAIRISSVSVKEIEYGRRRNPERMKRRGPIVDALLAKIEAIPSVRKTRISRPPCGHR